MFYTVYKITNLINSKIYVGVHKTSDLEDGYMGSGKHIKHAQNKYGIENFVKEVLHVFDNPEDMFNMESEIVNEDFVSSEETYNLKVGGFGGFDYINDNGLNNINHDLSSMGKTSGLIHKHRLENDSEYRLAFNDAISAYRIPFIGNEFKGRSHTEETKRKISEANAVHQKGEGNSQFGTMWIHNLDLKESRKIKKEEFPEYESLGWLKGRKMKF